MAEGHTPLKRARLPISPSRQIFLKKIKWPFAGMADRCLFENLKGRQRSTIPAQFSKKRKALKALKFHALEYIYKDICCQYPKLEPERMGSQSFGCSTEAGLL